MPLRTSLCVTLLAVLSLGPCLVGCTATQATSQPTRTPELLAYDFGFLLPIPTNSPWKGTLTYRNYTDNQSVTIPSTFLLTRADSSTPDTPAFNFAIGYDEEPHANSASLLEIRDQGTTIAQGDSIERVQSHQRVGDNIIIVTESTGTDDSKPATIRKVYTIALRSFSIQKLVRFDGTPDFFERHTYRWSR
jgi:hypothetical protein